MKTLRGIEVKRTKIKRSKIIPPYAVNSLWKELNYQDLHHEPDQPKLQAELVDLTDDMTPSKRYRLF